MDDLTAGGPASTLLKETADTSSRRRWGLFFISMSPVIALLALLTWGLIQSGGKPGGLLVNESLGKVAISASKAPAFEVATLSGGPVLTNEAVRGKVTFIDFWSSWCPPCRAEAADVAAVYHEYEGRPVEFLGVAIWDEPRGALAHIERFGITYPNGLDDHGQLAVSFGVKGVPEKYFLGPDGRIIHKFTGPISRAKLREILDELLNEFEL